MTKIENMPSSTESNKKKPTVSIIVPIYGVEQFIRKCAESLFSQTWTEIQYIFVDDGSPDRSAEILEEVLEAFPERKSQTAIIHQKNQGLPVVRKVGMGMATGEYIIQVDSDDWVEPDYISSLVEKAVDEDADVVYCDFFKEYEGRHPKIEREKDFFPSDGVMAVKAMHNSIIRAYMWNKLVKRDLINTEGLILPLYGYHEDIVFNTQILYNARKCVHLKRPLYHYRRRRSGSMTRAFIVKTRKHSALNMLHLYDSLPKDKGPVTTCGIDILLRAGWYSCIIMDFKLLSAYPEAVKILSEMKYVHNCRVPITKQVYTKMCCKILRLLWK